MKRKPEQFFTKLADGTCPLCVHEKKDLKASTVCQKCVFSNKSQFKAKKGG